MCKLDPQSVFSASDSQILNFYFLFLIGNLVILYTLYKWRTLKTLENWSR